MGNGYLWLINTPLHERQAFMGQFPWYCEHSHLRYCCQGNALHTIGKNHERLHSPTHQFADEDIVYAIVNFYSPKKQ